MASFSAPLDAGARPSVAVEGGQRTYTFDAVYEKYAPFVWRSVCRLGVPGDAADDVVQEIFVVVHRLLPTFVERTSIVPWLYAIVIHSVRAHRRTVRRKSPSARSGPDAVDPDTLVDTRGLSPHERAECREKIRLLYAVLDEMAEDRREVFVLAELEQLTAPEIAASLHANLNTVYWRLRMARQEFDKILRRHQARAARSSR